MEIKIEDQVMLIDDEDYSKISGLSLFLYKRARSRTKYVETYSKGSKGASRRRVHRIILGLTNSPLVVDHINGNGLDNRRENLRICTQKSNTRNKSKQITKPTHSIYKGVSKSPNKHTEWAAFIRVDYKLKYLGTFTEEVQAAKAYNEAAIKHFGEYAKINEIV